MQLHALIGALCVLITRAQPEISTLKSLDNDLEDNGDEYYPPLDWSDNFDWQLLKAVSSKEPGNLLMSPLSLKLALVMLYEGSAGSTEKQLQSILQFNEVKNETRAKYSSLLKGLQGTNKDYIAKVGTRLFLDSELQPNSHYGNVIKESYDTEIEATNFTNSEEASGKINSWIDALSNGHIDKLISADELQGDVLLFVANAVFFKGLWRSQFPKNNSHEGGFYVSPTEIVKVPFMSNTDKFYYMDSKELDAKILRLPYKGGRFSFFVILPNTKGGLTELLKNINLATLKRHLFLMDRRTVNVVIPRFKFDFSSSWAEILQEFGLTSIFSNTASFPGIAKGVGSGTNRLFVSEIKQQAGIELNEDGSTVFASTEIQLGNKFGEFDYNFNATHPFLFFLEDQITGTILFTGKVVDPLQTQHVHKFPSGNAENDVNPSPATSVMQATTGQQANFSPFPMEENVISSRFNYFDLEVLRAFGNEDNYFISPASIKITLAMILEGAKGRSAEQIAKLLRLPVNPDNLREKLKNILYDLSSKSGPTILESANAAYVSNLFHVVPEYRRNLEQYYQTPVQSVNFANSDTAAKLINNWVSNVTRGIITEIVNSANFNSDTGLVIANALYFKGLWKNEFDESSTQIKCFRTLRGCVPTKMMQTIDNYRYRFIEDLDAQAVELPYSGGEYAMLILVPSEKSSADDLQKDLQHQIFASIINTLEPSEVLINLPRFNIESSSDMVAALQMLGIEDIFSSNANLSGIVTQGQLKVNNIVHKTRLEVNEKGSTAAAATGVIVIPLMGSSMARVIADRPFLFFIYQVSNKNIIFEGRLNSPQEIFNDIPAKPAATGNQGNHYNRQDPILSVNQGNRFNPLDQNQNSNQGQRYNGQDPNQLYAYQGQLPNSKPPNTVSPSNSGGQLYYETQPKTVNTHQTPEHRNYQQQHLKTY